jgi:hypothetical protein
LTWWRRIVAGPLPFRANTIVVFASGVDNTDCSSAASSNNERISVCVHHKRAATSAANCLGTPSTICDKLQFPTNLTDKDLQHRVDAELELGSHDSSTPARCGERRG